MPAVALQTATHREVVWVWKRTPPDPDHVAHICDMGVSAWTSDVSLLVRPLCGAAGFQRMSFQPALDDPWFYNHFGIDACCVSCLVQLVMDAPQLFEERT